MKFSQVKMHAAVILPTIGAVNSINDTQVRSLDAVTDGIMITTLEGNQIFTPYANVPFAWVKKEEAPAARPIPMIKPSAPKKS